MRGRFLFNKTAVISNEERGEILYDITDEAICGTIIFMCI